MDITMAFRLGYYHGRLHGPASAADANRRYPAMTVDQVDAFGEGSRDGAVGDAFRLNQRHHATLTNILPDLS